MKVSLGLFVLLVSFSAFSMGISCEFQETSCNEKGDRYLCTYYGWAFGEKCSPTDISRRPNGTRPEFNCADCYRMSPPTKQCEDICHITGN